MLKIENIEVAYGGIEAVRGISFEVPEKGIVTLIGANGAGKTTTLRTIAGLLTPRSGRIHFMGEDVTGLDASGIVARGITLVPEGRRVFADMTVLENIKIGAFLRRDDISKDIERMYELFPILKDRRRQLAGTLSGGEQQMLALARALMSRPKLIMLDEPSLGLAPLIVRQVFEIITDLRDSGVTVLLVEQNANLALRCADTGYVMETGRITLSGKGDELLENESIKAAYLGA